MLEECDFNGIAKEIFSERTKFYRDITLLQKKPNQLMFQCFVLFFLDIIFISVKLFNESHKKKHGITVLAERDKAIIYIFVIKPSVQVVFRGYSWIRSCRILCALKLRECPRTTCLGKREKY